MAMTIAISGKGGSGKTTVAAMIVRLLRGRSQRGVLAVDADPNSCLGVNLGVEPATTIAEIREKARTKEPNTGTDRVRSFEYDIQQAITEADGFDLLTMGRPEGASCYCAANNLLRTFLDKLSLAYGFVVIDNEAGMEHLSRRTTNNVDLLCIVSEPTAIGTVTARRISELAKQLPISVKEIGVLWNKCNDGETSCGREQLEGIKTLGSVPYDKIILEAAMDGRIIFDMEENNPAFSTVRKIFENKL